MTIPFPEQPSDDAALRDAASTLVDGDVRTAGLVRAQWEPAVAAYTWQALYLMVWFESPRPPIVERTFHHLVPFMRRHPRGIVILNVIEPGSGPPDAESLARTRDFFEREGSSMRANTLLIDGSGFIAKMVIGVATALVAARRESFPQRMCRTAPEAAEFLLSRSVFDAPTSRADLEAVIAAARLDARRARHG